ncbi:Zn-ribbon domain-containing OB-fold protein [Actinophytocola sp.]|uniref:Zn-ribbon domain-containing OB-fold protein n=1 Tax=Actinophytocola sp. TaxID=1872138 RepID=UPI003D6C3D7B
MPYWRDIVSLHSSSTVDADRPARPLPQVDPDTAPFWTAARAHRLVTQRCASCGTPRFPPSPLCPRCRGWDVEWVELDGTGTVHSWVVVWHAVTDGLRREVPYVIALVEVAPGVRMPSRLVDCDVDAITEHLPVKVTFVELTPEITLPAFRPAT